MQGVSYYNILTGVNTLLCKISKGFKLILFLVSLQNSLVNIILVYTAIASVVPVNINF